MLFNPIITDFVKTSHLFHVIIIELKRQKQIYSRILPESKKIMSSKITMNRQRHKGAWLNRIQKEVEKIWPPPLSIKFHSSVCLFVCCLWFNVTFSDIFVSPSIRLSVCHKNFNLAHIFWGINDRTLIFGMHGPCDKPLYWYYHKEVWRFLMW